MSPYMLELGASTQENTQKMQRKCSFLDNNACAICEHCNLSGELNTLPSLLQEALQQNVSVCVCVWVFVDVLV